MCQLANYALETLGERYILLLEWCDRTPQFSGLSPVRRVTKLHDVAYME